ncbi:4'-phosphopantetheinyl transferase superfamily protein [Streptomyces sp. CG1]|uniref:4'-phosphopantetheinyl transferase family protein n=1 Tax=Streptomyces sp. CG1 TaxID=1287523 RepID=UPI0034E2153D
MRHLARRSTEPEAQTAGTGTVDVWWWRTKETVTPDDLVLLDSTERDRLAQMGHPEHAAEFVSCRAVIRRILAPLLDTQPGRIRFGRHACPGCGHPDHGPPRITEPANDSWISISHSSGLGLLAVADRPTGVDVERVRRMPVEDLARRAFSPAEADRVCALPEGPERLRSFLRGWTRKEAVLKGVGTGIATDLKAVEVRPLLEGPIAVTADRKHWQVAELALPDGWQGAVAVTDCDCAEVRLRMHP